MLTDLIRKVHSAAKKREKNVVSYGQCSSTVLHASSQAVDASRNAKFDILSRFGIIIIIIIIIIAL